MIALTTSSHRYSVSSRCASTPAAGGSQSGNHSHAPIAPITPKTSAKIPTFANADTGRILWEAWDGGNGDPLARAHSHAGGPDRSRSGVPSPRLRAPWRTCHAAATSSIARPTGVTTIRCAAAVRARDGGR